MLSRHGSRAGGPGRSRDVGLLTGALAAIAGLLAVLTLPAPVTPGPGQLAVAAALLVCVVAAESLLLHFDIGDSAHSASLTDLPVVLGLFWLDPVPLVVVRVVGAGLALALLRRQAAEKVAFNTASTLLEIVLALAVFRALLPTAAAAPVLLQWAAAVLACVASSAVGVLTVLAVISVSSGRAQFSGVPRLQRQSAVLASVTATLALVALVAIRADRLAAVPLLALAAAFAFLYRGHLQLSRRYQRLNTLYEFVRQVSAASQADGTVRTVLTQTRELLGADVAALTQVLDPEPGADPAARRLVTHRLGADGSLTTVRSVGAPSGQPVSHCLDSGLPLLAAPGTRDPGVAAFLRHQGVLDGVLVALPGAAGPAGALFVGGRRVAHSTFEHADVRALQGVASHAAVALQNGRLVDRLTYESRHDQLTGLPNRSELAARLQALLASPEPAAAVLLMDLDRFKDVNDTLGHHAGDQVLQRVGERLQAAVRPGATVARLGGDEFAVVLPGLDVDQALEVAARLRGTLEQPVGVEGLSVDVGVSIGVSAAPAHGDDASLLMRRADIAMYDAKSRSGVAAYDPVRDDSSTSRLALVAQLRSALSDGQLFLVYQPKVAGASGAVLGFEALIRWQHPQRGLVPPDDFIPVAERAGLLQDVTAWVLATSLDTLRQWRDAGHDVGVAVNLSPRNLLDPALPGQVRRELAARGLPADRLTLEITESTIMAEPARVVETLQQLRSTGVRLSIDDFGTGYSSLSYLKGLPVDEVKIDRSFVRGLAGDDVDVSIVRAVLALATSLDLDVVAEGVEDEAALVKLVQLGCQALQGYHISRPLPADDVLCWLSRAPRRAALSVVPPSRRASG